MDGWYRNGCFSFCCVLAAGFWFEFCVKLAKFDPPREFTPSKHLKKISGPKKDTPLA